ncbi:MAG TPA: carbon monoxide dehydrogenase subunit G [Rhizobium sp.]
MDMTGEERIAAPRDAVWAALNNPDILKQCIPGCQSLERISPTELTATVRVKIGPVSTSFNGDVTLSNVKAPESYTIFGEGKGGIAGFAKGGADVVLKADGNETILQYEARAEVSGKIAQFGARLVDSSAKKLMQRFFADFTAAINSQASA